MSTFIIIARMLCVSNAIYCCVNKVRKGAWQLATVRGDAGKRNLLGKGFSERCHGRFGSKGFYLNPLCSDTASIRMSRGAPRMDIQEIVERYQMDLQRYLIYLGADAHLAEDLAQEAFLRLWRRGLGKIQDMWAFLRRTARNLLISHHRRRGHNNPTPFDIEQAERTWTETFGENRTGSDYIDALKECLKTLSQKERLAVEMRYKKGLSRSEIAAEVGMTADGVKTLLRRVRARLAQCIDAKLKVGESR